MPTQKDKQHYIFASAMAVSPQQTDGKGLRKFTGVAYSGDAITSHHYWSNVVFDLSSMKLAAKIPALIDHASSKRCGYIDSSSIDQASGLTVSGTLLSNEHGQAVTNDSDEGFPWQMSVHIDPDVLEEVQAGATVNVNGRTFNGPITVFRNSNIREVSFTPTGCDPNTSAIAMSTTGGAQPTPAPSNQPSQEFSVDLKDLQTKIDALTAERDALQASNTELQVKLTEFSADARLTAVKTLFSAIGKEFKADASDVLAFAAMPQVGFDASASMLQEQHKANTEALTKAGLFSHSAQGGAPGAAGAVSPLLADAQRRAASKQ